MVLCLVGLTACEPIQPLGNALEDVRRFYVTHVKPLFSSTEKPAPTPSTTTGTALSGGRTNLPAAEYDSPEARVSMRNAELLSEMISVVLLKDPRDYSAYSDLLASLNQGASLEGIYNGLVLSKKYRDLEKSSPAAPAFALKKFGDELSVFVSQELNAPQFVEIEGLPTAMIYHSDVDKSAGSSQKTQNVSKGIQSFSESSPSGPTAVSTQAAKIFDTDNFEIKPELAEKFSKAFVGYSLYSLKRILAGEALRVLEEKSSTPEILATWYSHWVKSLQRYSLSYGLELRNHPEELFHYNWAMGATQDQMTWEVLNRVHRLLNEENK